ncbi:MAG TPA: porin [Gammaproteobacteria bacterium]
MSLKNILRAALAVSVLLGSNAFAAVEIYGRAHISLDSLDNGDEDGLNISSNSSRIGFRTETHIVEGLKGFVQLEQEIRFDNASGTFTTRDSFVGLNGRFGETRLGYFDTPLKKIRSETDFFNDQIGDARNLTRLNQSTITPAGPGGTPAAVTADFDTRFYNGIIYSTPAFAGFTLDLHHSTNNNSTNPGTTTASTNPPDDESAANSIGITYKAGDLYVSVANEVQEGRNDSEARRLGAKYLIGDLTLTGLVQQATLKPTTAAEYDLDTAGFGASYKLTDNTLIKAQIYNLSDDRDESDASLTAIGADYSLSKQFRLLFAYAVTDNDDLAAYRVSGGGHGDSVAPIVAGEDTTGVSAGIRYDFN